VFAVLYSYDDVTRCYEYVPPFVTVSLVCYSVFGSKISDLPNQCA